MLSRIMVSLVGEGGGGIRLVSSSTTAGSTSFFRFGSSLDRWQVRLYRCSSCSFLLGILLSPGRLNQETIAWSSEAFHDKGSVLFSLIASTFFLAFSYACFRFSAACNSFYSLCLVCSNTLLWILPSDKSIAPALKAIPVVIRRHVLNTSILLAWISSA